MPETVIEARNLAKSYLLPEGGKNQNSPFRYRRLTEEVWESAKSWAGAATSLLSDNKHRTSRKELFWALQDVNFHAGSGEVIGIIGKNGAGKSTLLKILSRITKPTFGFVEVTGTLGSLLEVGTGFHPELTGRENIFLNGAILGMSRTEVKRKFAEIVAFAEVERFLDAPVKRYSSGMYIRLAFAVAAHLEPDILIIDEVLAVGDLAFQKKCLGKMGEIAGSGNRTILFVSHEMATVVSLCTRVLWIDAGKIVADGAPADVIGKYLASVHGRGNGTFRDLRSRKNRRGGGEVFISSVELFAFSEEGPLPMPRMGDSLRIRFQVENRVGVRGEMIRLSLAIKTFAGQRLVHVSNEDDGLICPDAARFDVEVTLPELKLYPGIYSLTLWVGTPRYTDYDHVEDCLDFEVAQPVRSSRAFKIDSSQGLFLHASSWRKNPKTEP
jgi:lipopolysaccharide transport system ATP-binding protein